MNVCARLFADVHPPEIKCLPVVTHYLIGVESGPVIWAEPEVSDNKNYTLLQISGPMQGDVLRVGRHEVKYLAVDEEMNDSDLCTIVINVQGLYFSSCYTLRSNIFKPIL